MGGWEENREMKRRSVRSEERGEKEKERGGSEIRKEIV